MYVCMIACVRRCLTGDVIVCLICHFLTSHSGVDDDKKERGMDEHNCLSSVESTSRPLCVHDLVSLKVQVK